MYVRPITKLTQLRYLVEVLLVRVVLFIFMRLSLDQASDFGGWLGRRVGAKMRVTRIARKNLMRALPELPAEEHERIIIAMWDNLGRTVGEFPHVFAMSSDEFASRVTVEGAEYLERLKAAPSGGFLFSGHLGNWEMLPRVATEQGLKLSLIYRHANNPHVDRLITRLRENANLNIFPKGKDGAKNVLRALKNRSTIAMLVDQKMNEGISVPFFGIPAMTAPAIAKLALNFDCPIVPVRIIRVGGARFKVTVFPPMVIEKTDNLQQDCYDVMVQINTMLEGWICEHPEQWFWLHQRWPKT